MFPVLECQERAARSRAPADDWGQGGSGRPTAPCAAALRCAWPGVSPLGCMLGHRSLPVRVNLALHALLTVAVVASPRDGRAPTPPPFTPWLQDLPRARPHQRLHVLPLPH